MDSSGKCHRCNILEHHLSFLFFMIIEIILDLQIMLVEFNVFFFYFQNNTLRIIMHTVHKNRQGRKTHVVKRGTQSYMSVQSG